MGKTNDETRFPMRIGSLSVACGVGIKPLTLYEPQEEDVPYIYDQKTGNFHLLPKCVGCFQCISREIAEKGKAIVLELKSLIGKPQYQGITLMTKRIGGALSPIAPNKKYSYGHLFANIKVKKGDKQYFLFFIRFYIDEQKVHCILKKYQFRCENTNAYSAYPPTCDSGVTEIECRTFYNPEIPFECENNYLIAKCFLDFVMNN